MVPITGCHHACLAEQNNMPGCVDSDALYVIYAYVAVSTVGISVYRTLCYNNAWRTSDANAEQNM